MFGGPGRVGGSWKLKYTSSGSSVRFETGGNGWPCVVLNSWTLYTVPLTHTVAYTSGVIRFRTKEQLVSVPFRVRTPSDPLLFMKRSAFTICWFPASSISVVGSK